MPNTGYDDDKYKNDIKQWKIIFQSILSKNVDIENKDILTSKLIQIIKTLENYKPINNKLFIKYCITNKIENLINLTRNPVDLRCIYTGIEICIILGYYDIVRWIFERYSLYNVLGIDNLKEYRECAKIFYNYESMIYFNNLILAKEHLK